MTSSTHPSAPLLSAGVLQNGFFRHREGPLCRRELDPAAQALFQPGEQIVVVFDAVTRFPLLRSFAFGLIGSATGLALSALYGLHHYPDLRRTGRGQLEAAIALIAIGITVRLVCRLLGARRVVVALTTLGVVECRTDWLNRPRAIVQRGPVEEPVFYESSQSFPNVAIGPVDVYTSRNVELMLWRTMKRVRPQLPAIYAPFGDPWRAPGT